MMMGFGLLGLVLMLLFWGGMIVGVIVLIRALFPTSNWTKTSGNSRKLTVQETLDKRYARGEIIRESYEIMKQDLEI